MKNRADLAFLLVFIILGISCGKKDSSKNPELEPIDVADQEAPIQPTNPPSLPDDNAKPSVLNLAPLPASGVPLGYKDWDELNMKDPETRSLANFEGSDPAQELLGENALCSIYILAAYLNEKSQATYILRTSFKHNEQTHGWIPISIDADSTRAIGTGGNGQDQIFLQLAEAGNLLSATRMNLKWFHINHFDTGVCENLQLRTTP